MSTEATTAIYRYSKSKGSARLVLLAMGDEANGEGLLTAYKRSHGALSHKANIDRSSVARAVKTLVDLGELRVLQQGNGRASTDYQILLPGLGVEGTQDEYPAPAGCAPRVGRVSTQGTQDDPPIIPFSPGSTQSLPKVRIIRPEGDKRSDSELLTAAFEAFWKNYPRKTAKADARKAWPVAVKLAGGDLRRIVNGVGRYARDPNLPEQQFIPHPSKWLRDGRWDDEPLPARNGGRPTPTPPPDPLPISGPVTIDPDPDYDYEAWMDEHDPKWREREARGVLS